MSPEHNARNHATANAGARVPLAPLHFVVVDVAAYLEATADADLKRQRRIHRAWNIYRGNAPKPLRVLPGEPDDNVLLNLAGLIVDTGVDALFGQDIHIEVGVSDDGVDEPTTAYVNAVYEANREMLLFQSLATNGAVSGHAALRIMPPVEGSPPGTLPRLIVVDPEMLRVVWRPDDVGTVEAYVLQWMSYDQRGREVPQRQLIQRDNTGWRILEQQQAAGQGSRWVTTDEQAWNYTWPPIIDTQNLPEPNSYYGRPDLTDDVVDTNLTLNKVMSNAARVQRIHGHPKVVAKGVGEGDLDVGPDEAILLPDTDSEISLLEPRATVTDHIELFRTVKAALHEISRVPEVTAGKLDNVGNLSGLALKILYGPLVRKTEVKRRLYGDMVEELSRRLAEFGGFGPDHSVDIRWPEIIPSDPVMESAAAEALQRAGVSQATVLSEMGYDPVDEAEKRAQDQQNIGAALLTAFDRGAGATE